MKVENITPIQGFGPESNRQNKKLSINNTLNREELTATDEVKPVEIIEALEKINQAVDLVNKRLSFNIHQESERMQVLIIDNSSNEVIKEIPPEKLLDLVARIQEMVGLIIDERI